MGPSRDEVVFRPANSFYLIVHRCIYPQIRAAHGHIGNWHEINFVRLGAVDPEVVCVGSVGDEPAARILFRRSEEYHLGMEGLIRYGASPRATINLTLAARAHAFLNGRGYVTPQDIKSIGLDVLRHRVIVSYEAEAEEITSETVIQRIFAGLPVP